MSNVGIPARYRKQTKRKRLFIKQEGECVICGGLMVLDGDTTDPSYATIEHIIAKSKGGSDKGFNICLTHGRCNNVRKSKDFNKFRAKYGAILYQWYKDGWDKEKEPKEFITKVRLKKMARMKK